MTSHKLLHMFSRGQR